MTPRIMDINSIFEFKGRRVPKKEERIDDFPKVIGQRGISPEQYPDYE